MQLPHRFSQSKWLDLDGEFVQPVSSKDFVNFEQRGRLVRNGPAILITTPKLIKQSKLYGNCCVPYFMDEQSSIDIDNPIDFAIADMLLIETERLSKALIRVMLKSMKRKAIQRLHGSKTRCKVSTI